MRTSLIEQFTGISNLYEPPRQPKVSIAMRELGPDEAAGMILCQLRVEGLVCAVNSSGGSLVNPPVVCRRNRSFPSLSSAV